MLQGSANTRSNHFRGLNGHVGQIDATDHQLFFVQPREHAGVQLALRGFKRHLAAAAAGKLGQK